MTGLAQDPLKVTLLAVAVAGLAGGLGLWATGHADLAAWVWTMGVAPVLVALCIEIMRSLATGDVGLDIVAALSMAAALLVGETLAAAVVALMYSGGTFLESFAEGRARREMRDLLSRVPRSATRQRAGKLEEVPLDAIDLGDLLLIRQGELAPVDGIVESPQALLDQSALTGETLPLRLSRGMAVMSGATNAGEAFELRATARAADSTYAGIVRLVEAAQRAKAPMARLADRYALAFLGITVALAGAAWWATGDPIRAVAVLVVATPCPLILAVPVALVAGLSRAARFGVLIKGGKPLEAMARIRTLIVDKTGTLTEGQPQIRSVVTTSALDAEQILYFAASLEQASQHPVARAVVADANARRQTLSLPRQVVETPGDGVAGQVDGHEVRVGGTAYVAAYTGSYVAEAQAPGAILVAVAVDGKDVGYLVMADMLRPGTAELLKGLRENGLARIVLATGDRRAVAEAVTEGLGLDALQTDLTPEQKVQLVLEERRAGPVMMVGDGVNDAPVLAAADVGVAMGARGAAASAEAADVVLLVDDLRRLLPGMIIARGARRIALESVVVGIGLSIAGMIAAAFGYLTPVQGALLQEVIDVAVILNALRALRIDPGQIQSGTAGHLPHAAGHPA